IAANTDRRARASPGGGGPSAKMGPVIVNSDQKPTAHFSENSSGVHQKTLETTSPQAPSLLRDQKGRVITLPHQWAPRFYQLPTLRDLDSGKKRAVCVWHRRAGKDSCAINYTAKEAHRRIGVYWHVLPTQKQARKVIWQGIDKQGRRIIDQAFPKEL